MTNEEKRFLVNELYKEAVSSSLPGGHEKQAFGFVRGLGRLAARAGRLAVGAGKAVGGAAARGGRAAAGAAARAGKAAVGATPKKTVLLGDVSRRARQIYKDTGGSKKKHFFRQMFRGPALSVDDAKAINMPWMAADPGLVRPLKALMPGPFKMAIPRRNTTFLMGAPLLASGVMNAQIPTYMERSADFSSAATLDYLRRNPEKMLGLWLGSNPSIADALSKQLGPNAGAYYNALSSGKIDRTDGPTSSFFKPGGWFSPVKT